MAQSLRSLLAVFTLGVFVGFGLGGDAPLIPGAKGNEDVFSHERFRVTIRPAKRQVKPGEKFEAKLRVVNSSKGAAVLQGLELQLGVPVDLDKPSYQLWFRLF